jgi:hypothetical protein
MIVKIRLAISKSAWIQREYSGQGLTRDRKICLPVPKTRREGKDTWEREGSVDTKDRENWQSGDEQE